MNYDVFQKRQTAILFQGTYADLPSDVSAWEGSDLDAFLENLPVWCPDGLDRLTALFSNPIPGLRQHLANQREVNVVLAGEILFDEDFRNKIKNEYLRRGYDVVVMNGDSTDFTEAEKGGGVRISWR